MNDFFSTEERELCSTALNALKDAGIDFMLGGAFAVYHYTHWWRNTHDIDVYIVPDDVPAAIEALDEVGFEDIGEQAEGDKEWIYHASRGPLMVDIIWRFANLANYITSNWFKRAPKGQFMDMDIKFLPLEEVVWIKTFVINRHRCDWPDVMRMIRAQCQNMNWNRLLDLVGEHWLLLAGLVDVYDWQHPDSIGCIPTQVREELINRRREFWANPPKGVEREHLLDPWIHYRADKHAIWRNE